jgi:Putative Flp pilus-assembly TadE/G-like
MIAGLATIASRKRRRQLGQVLPIAAIAFIFLCAVAGLAIDASRDYLTKRDAQNAADFATLAAAKQLALSGNLSGPPISNSAAVKVAHDFAATNGFGTIYSTACDASSSTSFHTDWFDVPGVACGSTRGFTNRVQVYAPPIDIPGSPVPPLCLGAGKYSCVEVVITARVAEIFGAVIGVQTAFVTVGASAHATLPGVLYNTPPPNALVLYQPQASCATLAVQCFDETKPVGRSNLSCTGTNNCPTLLVNRGAQLDLYGLDGSLLTPAGEVTTLQSNGDMVLQDTATICDPYGLAACGHQRVVGSSGFALRAGSSMYCNKYATGASFSTPCTTTGQSNLQTMYGNQTSFISSINWSPSVSTSGLPSCGGLVLNGGPVSGPCASSAEPYVISPGIYSYIVINHGTYEFDPGLFDITGVAPVNTATGGGYSANGIDHSREVAADYDLCTGGQPNSCPGLTAGVWFGHGGGGSGTYVPPTSGTCIGSTSAGSSGGGGDSTVISGSGVAFRFESTSAGFVSTNEVTGLQLASPGVGSLAAVGGTPVLFDNEGSNFMHIDAQASSSNGLQGVIYQSPTANAGGVELNPGLATGAGNAALHGQVLAYSFATFGQTGILDFSNGYGTASVPGIATSGRNETSIIASVTLAATTGRVGYSTLTVNYTDEWAMDGYDAYIKVNNGTPTFFSQGIWNPTPAPGAPLPPPGNNPGDQHPAYHGAAGAYSVNPGDPTDWSYAIPNSNGSSIELKGSWTWGHQSDIAGAQRGTYPAQLIYTFPNPNGNYISISAFVSDGDRCGDYALAGYTFKNTGQPGGGTQAIGTVELVQ